MYTRVYSKSNFKIILFQRIFKIYFCITVVGIIKFIQDNILYQKDNKYLFRNVIMSHLGQVLDVPFIHCYNMLSSLDVGLVIKPSAFLRHTCIQL